MFNFDKNLSPSPPPSPVLHPTAQTSLFMLGACILFGAPRCFQRIRHVPHRGHMWQTHSSHSWSRAGHRPSVSLPPPLLLFLSSFNYLPLDQILPSQWPGDVRAKAGGSAAATGAKVPRVRTPILRCSFLCSKSHCPLLLRARTSGFPSPACWPGARLASGSWACEELNQPREGTNRTRTRHRQKSCHCGGYRLRLSTCDNKASDFKATKEHFLKFSKDISCVQMC